MLTMDLGIGGKVALVTAGTKGIGLGIAHALAAEGARVAVAARTEVDVKRTARPLGGLGVVADLLTEAGGRRAVSETEQVLGPVDILINTLGVRAGSSWADTGPAEFESAFVGNLGVSARMTQLVLPGMVERGWGRIVVIASVYGRESGGAPAYNAAKAAEISFTTSLAREVASQGVTANCVAPGSILWEGGGWYRRQQADPSGIDAFVRAAMPLGRVDVGEGVAKACASPTTAPRCRRSGMGLSSSTATDTSPRDGSTSRPIRPRLSSRPGCSTTATRSRARRTARPDGRSRTRSRTRSHSSICSTSASPNRSG